MLKLVYRENSESASAAENFIRDFKAQTGREIETINPDDAAGQRFIEAYDIVEYPTLIAIGFDGSEFTRWRGNLPTISDASIY